MFDTIIPIEPRDFLISKNDQETLTTPELSQYIEKQKMAEKVFHLLYFLYTVKKTTFFRQEKSKNIQYHYLYTPNIPKITTKLSIYPPMKNLNNDRKKQS